MSLQHLISGFRATVLLIALVVPGCDSNRSSQPDAQQPKSSAAPLPPKALHKEVGEASWYGPGFHGRETASGETFDQKKMTAAHPSLPMGTKATVTNLDNGKKVEVIINDRGPAAKEDRAIDLSSGAANKLDMKQDGTTQVKVETIQK